MGFSPPPSRAVGAQREGREGVRTKTQGSRPVLFYVAPTGQIQTVRTQFEPKFEPKPKLKLKPSSNPIQTVQTHLEPISNPNSNRSNPSRTHLEPQLEIHISSHAARNSKCSCNSCSNRYDKLDNQLPSVLFCFCTHKKNIFFVKH